MRLFEELDNSNLDMDNSGMSEEIRWESYSRIHKKRILYRELETLERHKYVDKYNGRYHNIDFDTVNLVAWMFLIRKDFEHSKGKKGIKFEDKNNTHCHDDIILRLAVAFSETETEPINSLD